ncbi:MAG: PQQ-binding-like beta-propeller repeat protein [Verrucomicrobiota bacterium]
MTKIPMKSLLFALTLLYPSLLLADWTQFRGSEGQGHAKDDAKPPLKWDEEENVAWRIDLPGKGWSSPIVYQGRIYLTTAIADTRDQDRSGVDRSLDTIALDAKTGEILWQTQVIEQDGRREANIHKKNSHASPTPLIAWNHLFVHFGHQGTACLNLSGKVLWTNQDLTYKPVHGNGGSPIVVGDKLIFSCDGPPDPFVAALNVKTGRLVWKTPRRSDASRKFSFCTPILLETDGRQELILPGSGNVFAYDPQNGAELWRSNYGQGYSVVPRPVSGHGLIFASSGYDRPAIYAVKPGGSGDVTRSNIAWTHTAKGAPRNASPLLVGDELYLFDDKGIGSCLDAKTGEVHWQERVGSDMSASPIYANGRIYALDEQGTTYVIAPGQDYNLLAENPLDERTLASIAVDGNALLIRTESGLFRIEEG